MKACNRVLTIICIATYSLIILVLLPLASCSGGDRGIPTNVVNNTNGTSIGGGETGTQERTFRLLKVGDRWEYTLSGYSSASWGTVYFTGSKVIEVTRTIKDPHGLTYYVLTETTIISQPAYGEGSVEIYIRQDNTGTIFLRGGYSGGEWWLSDPYEVPILLSPMRVGQKNNTDWISCSVEAQEMIEIDAGSFLTFKVSEELNLPRWDLKSRTRWYAPSIGAPVREVYTIFTPVAGSVVRSFYSFELSKYQLVE